MCAPARHGVAVPCCAEGATSAARGDSAASRERTSSPTRPRREIGRLRPLGGIVARGRRLDAGRSGAQASRRSSVQTFGEGMRGGILRCDAAPSAPSRCPPLSLCVRGRVMGSPLRCTVHRRCTHTARSVYGTLRRPARRRPRAAATPIRSESPADERPQVAPGRRLVADELGGADAARRDVVLGARAPRAARLRPTGDAPEPL